MFLVFFILQLVLHILPKSNPVTKNSNPSQDHIKNIKNNADVTKKMCLFGTLNAYVTIKKIIKYFI